MGLQKAVASTFAVLFSITCGSLPAAPDSGWQGAQRISAAGEKSTFPEIACDGSGNTAVLFSVSSGDLTLLHAQRYEPGVGWGGPVRLDTAEEKSSIGPQVAFDPLGGAAALYAQQDGAGKWRIRVNRYTADAGWGGPEGPIDAGARDAGGARIAFPNEGGAIVLFSQKDLSGTYRIYASRYRDGWGWAGPGDPVDAGTGHAGSLRIVALPSGGALAVFCQGDAVSRLYCIRWEGGEWSVPEIIDAGAGSVRDIHLAVGGDGGAMALFRQGPITSDALYANRCEGGEWLGPTAIFGDGLSLQSTDLSVDKAGNATVAYSAFDDSRYRVFAVSWEGRTGWGDAEAIDAGAGDASSPRLAVDARGNVMAVFYQSDGTADRVYANLREGGAWTGATRIDAGGAYIYRGPRAAADDEGNAICVFEQWDGLSCSVMANRYLAPHPLVDLTPDKGDFSRTDRISVQADVRPIPTKAYPFVRVITPGGEALYYERGRGFSSSPVPYLGFAAGPITLDSALSGYDALSVGFADIEEGTYLLEGGAVDAAATTSADRLFYLGSVDRETLIVR